MSGSGIGTPASAPSATAAAYVDVREGYGFQTSPFTSVTIDRLVSGGTVITWSLNRGTNLAVPYSFTVEVARSTADDWTTVGTTTSQTYTDTTQRDWSELLEIFYRIRLTLDDGSGYNSTPSNFLSTMSTSELRFIDEIRRKEAIHNARFGGVTMWLLSRKNWGTKCTSCRDEETNEVLDPLCSTCYGTGYVDGYWDPYEMEGRMLKRKQVVREGGDALTQMIMRVCPIPSISEKDVVVIDGSDERYVIESVDDTGNMAGKSIIQRLGMVGLSPGHVIYTLTWSGSNDPSDGAQTW
jgi:hypothetical protein